LEAVAMACQKSGKQAQADHIREYAKIMKQGLG
jgi:hypothetical protein